tara:strand:+ start:361 stop:540 length:180 start_codon:yes stop_codon:yes gene_type:complete
MVNSKEEHRTTPTVHIVPMASMRKYVLGEPGEPGEPGVLGVLGVLGGLGLLHGCQKERK